MRKSRSPRFRPVRLALLLAAVACVSESAPVGPTDERIECTLPADAVRRGDRLVFIRDFAFHPAVIQVEAGETVTWVSCEAAGVEHHTTTADGGAWASALLRPGDSYSHTFATSGSFGYYCLPHAAMRGTVVVR